MPQDLSHYDKNYFAGRDIAEQKAWDIGMLRYGDQMAAIGYAFGLPNFEAVRDLYKFKGEGTDARSAPLSAKKQMLMAYWTRKRTPCGVLDIGGGRGEVAIAFAWLGIDSFLNEPATDCIELQIITRERFEMPAYPKLLLDPAGDLNPIPDVDTVLIVETLEHIPQEQFDACWPKLVEQLRRRSGRLIVANWIGFHPIQVSEDGWDHIRAVDDALYDDLSRDAKSVFYRQGSHLVLDF